LTEKFLDKINKAKKPSQFQHTKQKIDIKNPKIGLRAQIYAQSGQSSFNAEQKEGITKQSSWKH